MTIRMHHTIVTLVSGSSLYLWDLDTDSPHHTNTARVAYGTRVGHGSLVKVFLEDGKLASIGPARMDELTITQHQLLDDLMREQVEV